MMPRSLPQLQNPADCAVSMLQPVLALIRTAICTFRCVKQSPRASSLTLACERAWSLAKAPSRSSRLETACPSGSHARLAHRAAVDTESQEPNIILFAGLTGQPNYSKSTPSAQEKCRFVKGVHLGLAEYSSARQPSCNKRKAAQPAVPVCPR